MIIKYVLDLMQKKKKNLELYKINLMKIKISNKPC